MLKAFFRAVAALFSRPLRRIVMLSLAIAVTCFVVLWTGVAVTLQHLPIVGWRPLNWLIELLGVVGVLVVSWSLFPSLVTAIMGLFLEQIAAAVESLHYPGRGPPRRQSPREIVVIGLRLMLLSIALNLLALPIYLMIPGVNISVFLGLNGYLFGREYFEMIALRRLDIDAVNKARHRFAGRIFLGGVIIAGTFALPFINLVAPVISIAFMVHLFEALPRIEGAEALP